MSANTWAVVNKATGKTVGTYATRTLARNNKSADDKVVKIDATSTSRRSSTVTSTTKAVDRPGSKKETARRIYNKMKATGAPRKEVIAVFTDPKGPLQLSAAGASTYYQNLNGGKW